MKLFIICLLFIINIATLKAKTLDKSPKIYDIRVFCNNMSQEQCMEMQIKVLETSKNAFEELEPFKKLQNKKVDIIGTWFGDINLPAGYSENDIRVVADKIDGKSNIVAFIPLKGNKTITIDMIEKSEKIYDYKNIAVAISDKVLVIAVPYR